MTTIYEQHDAAFSNVSAFVIAKDGKRVATIAFKFPRDGASRLYAYVHWLGEPMARGFAGGYEYEQSAACSDAARKLVRPPARWSPVDGQVFETDAAVLRHWQSFHDAIAEDGGDTWNDSLRKAGFEVWQAV
jgi:hypothetical protein